MPLLKPTEKENLNFIKKEELQAGPAQKFSKRGTDPPLLKRSGGRGGGGGGGRCWLWGCGLLKWFTWCRLNIF